MLPVAITAASRAPCQVRFDIFAIEFSKFAPTHKVARVAVCG